MKADVSNRSDIDKVVSLFYEKVKTDKVIGFFFSDVVVIDWEKHIPLMCSFWENILFHTGDYEGDPLTSHREIHRKYTTRPKHFKRWLKLFGQTIDELYMGKNAEKMKAHATGIAVVMQEKMR